MRQRQSSGKIMAGSVMAAMILAMGSTALAEIDAEGIVDEPLVDRQAGSEVADGFRLQIAGGMKGGVTGVAGYGFDNSDPYPGTDGNTYVGMPPEYYGHFGVGGGGGLTLEVRALGFVGLEVGFRYGQDNASGYVDKNDARSGETLTRLTSEQSTTSYSIPVLLKLNVPSSVVRPFLGVGLEFVNQSSSEIEYGEDARRGTVGPAYLEDLERRNHVRPVNYTTFMLTAGMEFSVGDVRIPLEFRGGYALGYEREFSGRAEFEPQSGEFFFDTIYMGHFGIFTGVLYEYDLLL